MCLSLKDSIEIYLFFSIIEQINLWMLHDVIFRKYPQKCKRGKIGENVI